MLKNQYLSDYVYLAEASYADFSTSKLPDNSYDTKRVEIAIINPDKEGNVERPESFAKLVTDNYEVVAHYKDRVGNNYYDIMNIIEDALDKMMHHDKLTIKESGLSATLFQPKNNAEYVLAIRGTAGFKDVAADLGDLVQNGVAYEQ